jgi:hypothetical protein
MHAMLTVGWSFRRRAVAFEHITAPGSFRAAARLDYSAGHAPCYQSRVPADDQVIMQPAGRTAMKLTATAQGSGVGRIQSDELSLSLMLSMRLSRDRRRMNSGKA